MSGVATVRLAGELDIATVSDVRSALNALDVTDLRLVLVDLAQVTFLDSTVLGVLVGTTKRLARQGVELQLIGAHGEPLRALRLTGLGYLVATEHPAAG